MAVVVRLMTRLKWGYMWPALKWVSTLIIKPHRGTGSKGNREVYQDCIIPSAVLSGNMEQSVDVMIASLHEKYPFIELSSRLSIRFDGIVDYISHWVHISWHFCLDYKCTQLSVNWENNGSDNYLSPVLRQAITWTNGGLLLIRLVGTNFREIWIGIIFFSFKKMHLKLLSARMAAISSRGRWVNKSSQEPIHKPIHTECKTIKKRTISYSI